MSDKKKNNRQFNGVKSERVVINSNVSRKKAPRSNNRTSQKKETSRTSEHYTSYGNNRDRYYTSDRYGTSNRPLNTQRNNSRTRSTQRNGSGSQGSNKTYNNYTNYGTSNRNVRTQGHPKEGKFVTFVKRLGNFTIDTFSLIKKPKFKRTRVIKSRTASIEKNSIARPMVFVFFLFVTVYMFIYGVNFLTKGIVKYDVLGYGTIDTPKSAEAVIIRDEKIYTTPEAGVISYDIADKEKVRKGAVVCSIKDEAVVKQMQANLDKINEEIMNKQSERGTVSVYSEDVERYNAQIKAIFDEKAMDYAYMKLGNIYELKNTVQNQLDTRNQYLLSENSGALKDLVEQKKEQENKINENIVNIPADESGIVSYYIDGLESEYTVENMQNLKKNQIISSNKSKNSFKSSVKANSPVFKLVTSNIWYIATYINKDYIKNWEKGDNRYIYIKDENGEQHSLDAYVYELIPKDDKESFVIFKLTKDMIDFINNRNITIETESTEKGFKIPNTSIVEETLMRIPKAYIDDEGYVYKASDNSTKKVAVTISGIDEKDSEYCYTPVQLGVLNVGDTINNPNGTNSFVIADVLNTKGIYVSNSGIAEFKTINLNNSVSNSTHTIISPKLNTNIYIYDRVIIDPRNIEKEEILYK